MMVENVATSAVQLTTFSDGNALLFGPVSSTPFSTSNCDDGSMSSASARLCPHCLLDWTLGVHQQAATHPSCRLWKGT